MKPLANLEGLIWTPETTPKEQRNFITLENISCIGSDGQPFETYDRIRVATDIERAPDGSHMQFTPYQATTHFEDQGNGLFLPSFALSCNILATLYENRIDAEFQKILMQYNDYGIGHGWHIQNTVVNWKTNQIIHYPNKNDYTNSGGNTDINTKKTRTPLNFNNTGFQHMLLEEALKNKDYRAFLQNLTGLQNPQILIEIGAYFGNPAKSWISSSTGAAWLGCDGGSFNLYTSLSLDGGSAARGVSGGVASDTRGRTLSVSLAAASGATPKKRDVK